MTLKKYVLFLGMMALASSAVYGASAGCPSATGSYDPSGAGYPTQTQAVTIAGVGSNTTTADNALGSLNSYSSGPNFSTGGCLATDLSFNNFRVISTADERTNANGTVTTSGTTPPTMANTYAAIAGLTTGATAVFSTVRGDGGNNSDANNNEGINNFFDTGSTTSAYDVLFTVDAGAGKLLTGSSVVMRYYNFTDDVNNSVSVYICGNYTTTTVQTTAFSDCSSVGGTLITYTQSLASLYSNDNSLNTIASNEMFGLDFDRAYVRLRFTLDGDSTNPANGNFTNSYAIGVGMGFSTAVPEPSSWAMMGSALLLLGARVARKRRS